MNRVLIIGSPGSGKSTLATELARRTGLPLIHLDQEYWLSGWIEPSAEDWRRKVVLLVAGERWVMDGNYGGSLDLRLARADTVIDLRLSAWLCVWRILRRLAGSRRRVRPDMAEGCPERFDPTFLLYTATFPSRHRKRTDAKLSSFRGTYIELRTAAEVRRLLAQFEGPLRRQ